MATTFRFRPRYRGIAWTSVGVGGTLSVIAIASLGGALLPLVTGSIGVALGVVYLRSPFWSLAVVIDDAGVEVRSPRATRFKLAWADVVEVVSSPATHTCFVNGGTPATSLLVPGDGAPAPYDIEDKPALCAAILAHVDPAKVRTVDSLDKT